MAKKKSKKEVKRTLSEMIDQTLREVITGRTFVPAFDASDDEDVLRVAQQTRATDSDDLDDKIGNWYQDQIEFDSVKWKEELGSELRLISNEISEVIRKAIPSNLRRGGLEMGRVDARAEYDRHDDLDVTISFDVVVRRERDLSGEQASRWQEVLVRALTENLEPDQINDYGTLSDYELIYKINEPAQRRIDEEIEFFTKEARADIAKRSKHIDKLLAV